jgi:hypothetical protein
LTRRTHPGAAPYVRQVLAMRFWVGLLLGLFIGAAATVAYYELWDSGAEEDVSPQTLDRSE